MRQVAAFAAEVIKNATLKPLAQVFNCGRLYIGWAGEFGEPLLIGAINHCPSHFGNEYYERIRYLRGNFKQTRIDVQYALKEDYAMTIDPKTLAEVLQLGGQYLLPIAALLRALYAGVRG